MIDKENIDSFISKCKELKEIHLAIVTSSVSTKLDPQNKENLVFDSHFSGLVTALKLLSNGGNLIMKSFSMFNAVNVSLMYFLNLVFENVHLFKPATAQMTKFEYYIIGIDFKKDALAEKYIEEMRLRVGPNSLEEGIVFCYYLFIYILFLGI